MTDPAVTPVFVLSLPRSGSTLVQRVLATDPAVATTSEPWVVLPLLYAVRHHGVAAEYDHATLATAITSFAEHLTDGPDRYRAEARRMLLRLYAAASPPGTRWFVDKTPRYHLVVDELLELFPTSPVIILWRNPLAVVASMTATWHRGRWYPHRHGIDLYTGLAGLAGAARRHADRVTTVRFEDLVTGPAAWGPIADQLSIDVTERSLAAAGQQLLPGPVGDPGQSRYGDISRDPVDKWTRELASPVRRRWARKYLHWIGDERLEAMGYDGGTLRRGLDELDVASARAAPDVWDGARERTRSAVRRWQEGGRAAHEWPPGRTGPNTPWT